MHTILKNVIKIITLPNPPQSNKTKLYLQYFRVTFIKDSDLTNLSFQLPLTKLSFIIYTVYTYVILLRPTK